MIRVYVEGYEDVAFWRGVFDDYESDRFTFEISVPLRDDLAKGKKVVLGMADGSDRDTMLCVDSDFDYLFADQTEASRRINGTPNIFHTYAYATENYQCYAPSLHNICVKGDQERHPDLRLRAFLRGVLADHLSAFCLVCLFGADRHAAHLHG